MKNYYSQRDKGGGIVRKAFLSAIALAFGLSMNTHAQTIQVGTTAAGSTYFPNYYLYDYSYSQTIYTAAELAAQSAPAPGYINKIRYLPNASVSTSDWNSWTIYLGNTAQASFTGVGNFIPPASMTQVFSGAIPANVTTGVWMEITLSTPFLWDGTSNIVVSIDENTPTYGSSPNWRGYTLAPPTGFKGIRFYQDNTDINPASPSALSQGTSNAVAAIQFEMVPSGACTSPPTAGVVGASLNPVCPSVSSTLSLSGGTNGTGQTYQWQSSTSGAPGTFTNIVGAIGSGFSASQTVNTYYRCYVTCSGLTDTTAALLLSTNSFLNCYCSSSATYTSDEEILNVSIGTLNNSSTCSTTGGPGSTLNLYSNYTALTPPILAQTAGYPFTVQIGTCGSSYNNMTKIYIDYNQNGLFTDPGEQVYVSPTYTSGAHTETGSITIPLTAIPGITRMRVVTVETSTASSINPCGTYSYGETEDYFVNIAPAPTCPQPTALTNLGADNSSINLAWTNGGGETQWQIEYGPVGFTQGTGTLQIVNSNPYTLGGLTSNQFYSVYIRAICSPGDSSYWAGPLTFNTYNQGLYIDWNSDCPTAGFIDISSTGTNLNLTEDGNAGVTLPFSLLYQGQLFNNITIGNNAGILLGTLTGNVGYSMVAGNGLYPYVQDMYNALDGVYYETVGTAPNRKFVVMWSDVPHYFQSGPGVGVTFEVIIDEATNEIYYVYQDVDHANPTYDFGKDAEIGIRGTQNINVSMNNTTYLQNNSCVKFFYTDCPKPINFVPGTLTQTDFSFTWTAGASNETQWIVEYGPAGFTPGTGTILNETSASSSISGLTQVTNYTVYVYANCANGDTSLAISYNFTTLPFCSNPTAIGGTSLPDTMKLTWNWTESSALFPIQSFNIQYGMTGFGLYSSNATIVPANGTNLNDTVADASLIGSGVYQVYVQAVCQSGDTSAFAGPFTIVMPRTNDVVCQQEGLQLNTTYTFNNAGATVQSGESAIAPPATGAQTNDGWASSTLAGTLWYTFVAPASGSVRINATTSLQGYDGKAAVYKATNCASFATFTMISANDDDMVGSNAAPNFTACGLTPGNTYYILFDRVSGAGNFSLHISEITLDAGNTNSAVTNVCSGTVLDLNTTITTSNATGTWFSPLPAVNASITGSMLNTGGLAYQSFNIEYRVTDGCAYDSIVSVVKIFAPSNAGQDGTITACKNQPINLYSGLTGNVDMGGQWYDPSNATVPSSVTTSNFPGQYNFHYITSNGVCPADTALLVITVQATCNWLSLEEAALEDAHIYPNPSTGIININAPVNGMTLVISDINGRVVETIAGSLPAGTSTINLKDVERGTYFFTLNNGGASKVFRIVMQ
jgi:hypothetical protein